MDFFFQVSNFIMQLTYKRFALYNDKLTVHEMEKGKGDCSVEKAVQTSNSTVSRLLFLQFTA